MKLTTDLSFALDFVLYVLAFVIRFGFLLNIK